MAGAGFVSCDVVGHSAVKELAVQRRRLEAINALVRAAIQRSEPGSVVWASGGDGGHVAFFHDDWPRAAIDLVVGLHHWARDQDIPLRLAVHHGEVDRIEGADGRVQLVGEGINLAGQLLAAAFPQGVLASAAFKEAVEAAGFQACTFHHPRILRPRHFPPQLVYLLSVPGQLDSFWDHPAGGDRDLLELALAQGRAWQALFHAKRLLQTCSLDDQAEDALDQLGPHVLLFREQVTDADGQVRERWAPNPFLGELDAKARRDVIHAAQLVQRRRGEVLCRAGEAGDTMFIVLGGEVAVFSPGTGPTAGQARPRHVVGPGEIVGELAFTLHRPRTADLVALEDTALLSIHAAALQVHAQSNPGLSASLEKFLTRRTLEFTCNELPYLIGKAGDGPLAEVGRKKSWDRLLPHAEKIVCPLADPRPLTLSDPRFARDGLYILVSGQLRSLVYPDKVLSSTDLPLVYVDLPGWVVCPSHPYRPEGDNAILLRIGKEALLGRRPVIDAVAARLLPELPRLYHFDVFLSYTLDDQAQARRWYDALRSAGLRVYMEVATSGRYFTERIEAGILDSLTLLALVSANTMVRPLEQNWVRREIVFRQSVFEPATARIFPVRLKGGNPEALADGYTIIESVEREEAALAEVIEAVRLTRQAENPPPFALARKSEVRL